MMCYYLNVKFQGQRVNVLNFKFFGHLCLLSGTLNHKIQVPRALKNFDLFCTNLQLYLIINFTLKLLSSYFIPETLYNKHVT